MKRDISYELGIKFDEKEEKMEYTVKGTGIDIATGLGVLVARLVDEEVLDNEEVMIAVAGGLACTKNNNDDFEELEDDVEI